MKEHMKRLLGKIVQAVIISTIAVVAVLNSSVQNAKDIPVESSIPSVTVVTAE
jgi:hypothetical protein